MRRHIAAIAVTAAGLLAALPGAAGAYPTNWTTNVGFGPGQYGQGNVGVNFATGADNFTNANLNGYYVQPGCIYCNNTLMGSATVQTGSSVPNALYLSAGTGAPLPYHSIAFQYVVGSGPSWSYN